MAASTGVSKARIPVPQPTPVDEDEVIDLDCSFDDPPAPKQSGRIEAALRQVEDEPSPI